MTTESFRRRPAEIFGHPINDISEQACQDREACRCPFLNQKCWKPSRQLGFPFGICSVYYGHQVIAVCPSRFREGEKILRDVADHYFGTRNNLLVFNEVNTRVKVPSGRSVSYSFDYVIVKHKELSTEIEDFVVVELQTVDTTSTRALVKAIQEFMGGDDIYERRYKFGLNLANVWKRCFVQILREGVILERWGHKIYWIAQEPAYQYLLDSHGLHGMTFDRSHTTVFMIYDLLGQDRYELVQTRVESETMNQLFFAFQNNVPIPSKDTFIQRLEARVRADQALNARLGIRIGEG